MNDEQCKAVRDRLDLLIRLTAISIAPDKTKQERIAILGATGLSPKEIAELLDTTPNAVSVALSKMRKGRKGPK